MIQTHTGSCPVFLLVYGEKNKQWVKGRHHLEGIPCSQLSLSIKLKRVADYNVMVKVHSRYQGYLPAPEESNVDDRTESIDKLEDKCLEDEPLLKTFVCFRHF